MASFAALVSYLHVVVRAVGALVVIVVLIGSIYLYFSASHDFRCNVFKQIEREQAGKEYSCIWPAD